MDCRLITFGHEGHIAQAKALLKEAESTCRLHRQSRIRELYLIGFIIGIIVTITIGYIIVILLNLLEPSFHINFLVIIFIFSGIGSIVSALTRLKSLDVREGSSDFDIMLSGSVRPIVAMFFSLIAYLMLSIKAFKVSIGDSDANPYFVFYLAAFRGYAEAGPSDRLRRARDRHAKAQTSATGAEVLIPCPAAISRQGFFSRSTVPEMITLRLTKIKWNYFGGYRQRGALA
jgi:hypothetical protein